jgi:ubiquinone/menaquinone biosynthesis C-methylase UbiE
MESDGYLLERSAAEYQRLRHQARMWEPESARLLDRVGLAPGARCLDVGCGPGETMRLMAERVGLQGEVAGVDVDAPLGAEALDMLHAAGHESCRFERLDAEAGETPAGAPFDLVFARLLLLHAGDPVAVLRRLWDWVAPGGHLVVQDYDLLTGQVVPELQITEEFFRVARGTFPHVRIGLSLPALHVGAGVGPPDGVDAGVRLGRWPRSRRCSRPCTAASCRRRCRPA